VIPQPSWRADHHVGAVRQGATFPAHVGAADAGDDPEPEARVKPLQLAADLQRQLPRRCNDQHAGPVGSTVIRVRCYEVRRRAQAVGDGLARAGLRRDQQVAPGGLRLQHGCLHGRRLGIAAGGQSFKQCGME
jgi:hypothetical protein